MYQRVPLFPRTFRPIVYYIITKISIETKIFRPLPHKLNLVVYFFIKSIPTCVLFYLIDVLRDFLMEWPGRRALAEGRYPPFHPAADLLLPLVLISLSSA